MTKKAGTRHCATVGVIFLASALFAQPSQSSETREARTEKLELPRWLQPFEGILAQKEGSPPEVSSSYDARVPASRIVDFYQQELKESGVTFETAFDGIGTSIRASEAKTLCVVRIEEVDGGSRVRASCALRVEGNASQLPPSSIPQQTQTPASEPDRGGTASVAQRLGQSSRGLFTISVQGGRGVQFKGTYLISGETAPQEFKGVVPASKNGGTLKRQRTDAPYGVISLSSIPPAAVGAPIFTEIQIEGVHFALIAYTSETGDIQQELLPVPFDHQFYPRAGSIISVTAQKTRVIRVDPTHLDGRLDILDDGRNGTLRAVIRVNGTVVGSAETAEAFGVASVTVKVP